MAVVTRCGGRCGGRGDAAMLRLCAAVVVVLCVASWAAVEVHGASTECELDSDGNKICADGVGDAMMDNVADVKDIAVDNVKDAKDAVIDSVGDAADFVADHAEDVKDALSDQFAGAKDTLSESFADARDTMGDFAAHAKVSGKDGLDQLSTASGQIMDSLQGFFASASQQFKTGMAKANDMLPADAKLAFDRAKGAGNQAWIKMKTDGKIHSKTFGRMMRKEMNILGEHARRGSYKVSRWARKQRWYAKMSKYDVKSMWRKMSRKTLQGLHKAKRRVKRQLRKGA